MDPRRVKATGIRRMLRDWKLTERDIPFPTREYDRRLARLRVAMKENGLDLVFLSSPESMFYLSGYRSEWYQAQGSQDWYPASGIAVHRDRDPFIMFEVEDEYLLVRHTSVARDIRGFRLDREPWGWNGGAIVPTGPWARSSRANSRDGVAASSTARPSCGTCGG